MEIFLVVGCLSFVKFCPSCCMFSNGNYCPSWCMFADGIFFPSYCMFSIGEFLS